MAANSKAATESFRELLYTAFPVAIAMQVGVDTFRENQVVLRAPIAPNKNVHGTGFAGSLYSVAALACWGLAHGWIERASQKVTLLIGRGEIEYNKPIRDEFTATASIDDNLIRDIFLDEVSRGERAQVELVAVIASQSETTATFKGDFIVLEKGRNI